MDAAMAKYRNETRVVEPKSAFCRRTLCRLSCNIKTNRCRYEAARPPKRGRRLLGGPSRA